MLQKSFLFPETVSQRHPEAVAEGSRLRKRLKMRDSSPAVQNDIRMIFALRHSLSMEEVQINDKRYL